MPPSKRKSGGGGSDGGGKSSKAPKQVQKDVASSTSPVIEQLTAWLLGDNEGSMFGKSSDVMI